MKKFWIIGACILTLTVTACNRVRHTPGHAYMPDMVYSIAYETYAPAQERLDRYGAHYNNQPVAGTIARGDMFPYKLKNDSAGLLASDALVSPLASFDENELQEAGRLYLINCGICHGAKLDGNGPLFNGGNGPFTAAPKNFLTDKAMTEGHMFHVATYGKGQMGSYASQLSPKQRWMIVHYIKQKQGGGGGAQAAADSTGGKKPAADSATMTMKK